MIDWNALKIGDIFPTESIDDSGVVTVVRNEVIDIIEVNGNRIIKSRPV